MTLTFVEQIAPWAVESEREHGIPAAVTIAQAILESGRGTSELAVRAQALFGIKYSAAWASSSPYVQGAYDKLTWEQRPDGSTYQVTAPFCRYLSWRESVLDHGLFLRRDRYRPALDAYRAAGDVDAYARAIHAAGYATDLAYADKLIALIDREGLRRYRPEEVTTVRLALIYSRQPGNPYTGGSNENAEMYKLAAGLAPLLRAAGVDVEMPDNTDFDRSGTLTYADNVAWVKARHRDRPFDRLISLHSNAMGNACILYGTSSTSHALAKAMRRELDAARILPYGDTWELNERKVAEVADTPPPAVLLEVGQHDRADYADWLRRGIADGSYARALAGPILRALGIPTPTTPTTTTTMEEDMPTPADLLNAPIPRQGSAAGTDTTLAWEIGYLPANFAGLQAAVAALSRQVAGLAAAASGEADLDKIAAAAKAGAAEALVASQGPLAAAVEDLTSALDQLDPAEITQAVSEAVARLRVIVAPAEEATHG